jgi:hypothetical protein
MSRNGMTQPRAFFQNAITAGFFFEFWICSFVPILGPILSLFLQSLLAVFGLLVFHLGKDNPEML